MSGTEDAPKRKRGRPSGKNRVPLSTEERRARNALYERERREGLGEALKDLGELFECDQNISTHKLLEMVYKTIKKSKKESKRTTKKKRTIEELLSQNLAISEEIKKLEEDLDEFSLRDWVDMPEEGYG